MMADIVVIGAGVSGLTSALLLARTYRDCHITVVARHMPGDYDIQYTSPWAGANVLPMATEANSRWERETWPELRRLAADVPEAGIHFQKARLWRRAKDVAADRAAGQPREPLFAEQPWFRTLFDDFCELDAAELPEGIASGCEWTSVCINTMLYLPWLVGQCRALGVIFRRGSLGHIAEAKAWASSASAPLLIVNCSGLMARRLGGVEDTRMRPARGQVVVIREELEPMLCISSTGDDDSSHPDELIYCMTRAAGGGTVVGGTYQMDNWESQPDPNVATRILQRIVATHPTLRAQNKTTPADLDIVRHGVGLRPYRDGGVRLEAETLDGLAAVVVHNYGHAGWGYQGSYGCAGRVVELVGEALQRLSARRESRL